jgi:DUF438 domain-containing protein
MSDYNSEENKKKEALKQIIKDLHAGVSVEDLQKKFARLIKDTSPEEIANMENALIQEGFPPSEIQRLCDVHAQVFEQSLSKVKKIAKIPGHPIYTFIEENKEAKKILKKLSKVAKKMRKPPPKDTDIAAFKNGFNTLKEIEKHYQRKENQLFPALEAKGFTGPTKVMWGKHDEIRSHLKKTESLMKERDWPSLYKQFKTLLSAIKKMVFLEEKILYPTSAKKLDTMDWVKIKKGGSEIGYAWVTPSNLWDANLAKAMKGEQKMEKPQPERKRPEDGKIKLEEGYLTAGQLILMLKKLPIDITFVDENDTVCFYSASEDRIFPRSPAIIGRAVQNCHPPKSVHIVEDILRNFKEKKKDVAEFWLQMEGKFIHIRYFPVYNAQGEYKGVIEVSQEVSAIRALEGERRILDW